MTQKTVLLADDHPDSRHTLAALVELLGFRVLSAADGTEAVALARDAVPPLVILDIGMPRMDGLEACRQLRRLPGGDKATIVALTGWGSDLDKIRTAETGFDVHLTKPVDMQRLLQLLA